MSQVIMGWDDATLPAKVISISKQIGATDLLVVTALGDAPTYLRQYVAAGFGVYIMLGCPRLPTPADLDPYMVLPIKGIGVDFNFSTTLYPVSDVENSIISCAATCIKYGKEFAYYHGDGALHVNALTLAAAGCIVWDHWSATAGYPAKWDPGQGTFETLPKVWAQIDIWNNRPDHPDLHTSIDHIWRWFKSFPRTPTAMVFWQTTDLDNPSDDQIQGIAYVAYRNFVVALPDSTEIVFLCEDGRLAAKSHQLFEVISGWVGLTITMPDLKYIEDILHVQFSIEPITQIYGPFNKRIIGNVVGMSIYIVSMGGTGSILSVDVIAVGPP